MIKKIKLMNHKLVLNKINYKKMVLRKYDQVQAIY